MRAFRWWVAVPSPSGAPSPSFDQAASCQVCTTLSLNGEGDYHPAKLSYGAGNLS